MIDDEAVNAVWMLCGDGSVYRHRNFLKEFFSTGFVFIRLLWLALRNEQEVHACNREHKKAPTANFAGAKGPTNVGAALVRAAGSGAIPLIPGQLAHTDRFTRGRSCM